VVRSTKVLALLVARPGKPLGLNQGLDEERLVASASSPSPRSRRATEGAPERKVLDADLQKDQRAGVTGNEMQDGLFVVASQPM